MDHELARALLEILDVAEIKFCRQEVPQDPAIGPEFQLELRTRRYRDDEIHAVVCRLGPKASHARTGMELEVMIHKCHAFHRPGAEWTEADEEVLRRRLIREAAERKAGLR